MNPLIIPLLQFAPEIAKWLTGPESVVSKVTEQVTDIATTVSGTSSISEAIDVFKVNQSAAQDFKKLVLEKQFEWDKLYFDDLASARNMAVELAKAGKDNTRANILAAFALVLTIGLLLIVVYQTNLNEFAKGTITLLAGRCLGWIEQIFSFEFGTTKVNRSKDETIVNLSKGV